MKVCFRFQTLEIWEKAVAMGGRLLNLADDLEERKLFRFAEQARGAALRIASNIAEGSGSSSDNDFANFRKMARRSSHECPHLLPVFARRGLVPESKTEAFLLDLDTECRMIESFRKALKSS